MVVANPYHQGEAQGVGTTLERGGGRASWESWERGYQSTRAGGQDDVSSNKLPQIKIVLVCFIVFDWTLLHMGAGRLGIT